jgi:effector-binding domain-containing protein
MQITTHPPVRILYSTHRVTLKQLGEFGAVIKELYAEAVHYDAFVSGPLHWIYRGADGKPDTVFTLEIAIPIQGYIKTNKFQVKQLAPFDAITYRHEGSWERLVESYTDIMQYVDKNKIPLNEECRELYLNMDFENPENNVTEVQVGIFQTTGSKAPEMPGRFTAQ